MTFDAPVPFAEAIAKLAGRNIVPSAANSYQWRAVETALRERAFFSSRVESARVLQSMRDYLGDYLANTRMDNGGLLASGRAEFVADMRELAIREGLGKIDPKTGRINPEIRESDLTDIRSIRRLQLIFDTQTEASQEYGYWLQGLDPDILNVYPAQRFIRIRPVLAPRPYHAANEGAIRRKDDLKFWLSMNRDFGVPWGPWGYGSGMGVEDVDRDEAEAAGILKPGERVTPAAMDFNDGLSAGVLDFDSDILAALRRATGGTSAAGRLAPTQAAPAPAAAVDMAVALRAAGIDPAADITADQARALLAQLRKSSPANASDKIISITGASKKGVLTKKFIEDTMQEMVALLPPGFVSKLPEISIEVKRGLGGANGEYSEVQRVLRLSAKSLKTQERARKTLFHELFHWAHDHGGPDYEKHVRDFFNRRTAGEQIARLSGFGPNVRGLKDKWADADGDEYAGRVYDWEIADPKGTEVVTRHLEKLSSPVMLERHWNHAASDGSHPWREAFLEVSTILFP